MSKSKTAICKELIKDYCANCTFAGIHYIADENKHITERLLWLVLVILSWYGSALLIISAWEAFRQSPISFVVETTYIDWNTTMPTVAICETYNRAKLFNVSDTIWPRDHLLDLEDALKEIAYFRGVAYVLVGICFRNQNPDPLCPKSNYSYLAKLVRSDCDTILKNCSYNDEEFPCCEYFQPIETDVGPCFILNSVQTKEPHPYPMVNNLKNNRGSIQLDVRVQSTMYTLGENEVPTITTLLSSTLKIQLGYSYRRILSVRNIKNDPLITETTTEQRACRFPDENEGGLYPKYSYSACTVLCRKRAQLDLCKCYDHFMLGTESERCNLSGIACLNSRSSQLTTLKPVWSTRPGLTCDCLPSCDETEITVIKDIGTAVKGKANKKMARVEIGLAHLPTERFKRNVVRSRLDLVVSVGGTTGLFVGASLLSFVELFFFFTVRFANNILKERKNRGNVVAVKPIHMPIMERIPELEETGRNIIKRVKFYKEPYLTSGVPNIYSKMSTKNTF